MLDGLRQQVFLDRYALRDEAGNVVEQTPNELWQRVARAIAQVEEPENRDHWTTKFYHLLTDFKFVPGGRILSGAGTGNAVTFYNCFVIPSPEDSREGILACLSTMTEIMARGGGVGINFSTIRPRGSHVKSVNGTASGPVNWMEIFSVMTGKVIQQGGSRRGALMAMLDDDHPDILEFIEAKRIDPATGHPIAIEHANVSVAVSDAFMQAVKDDAEWRTQFPTRANTAGLTFEQMLDVTPGPVYRARDLWRKICERAWATAEPGVVFMERAQREANTGWYEKIRTVNPCLTGDALVASPGGWRRLDTVQEGEAITTCAGSGIVKTVEAHDYVPVYRVRFSDGGTLTATAAHQFHILPAENLAAGYRPTRLDEVAIGDYVRVAPAAMPENPVPDLPSQYTEREFGFLLGTLIGNGCITDGVLARNRVKLAVDTRQPEFNRTLVGLLERSGGHATFSATEGHGGHYTTQAKNALATVIKQSALTPGPAPEKRIPLVYQNTNERFLAGLLDGLFSADGNVNLSSTKPQVRLTTTSAELATDVRRVLLSFGIHARIYTRQPARSAINGREIVGRHLQYNVVIAGAGLRVFYDRIGLAHPEKSRALDEAVAHLATNPQPTWRAKIVSIEPAGVAPVYDLYEPTTDTWIAEGYVSRGCGEQPLPDYGVCNLGAMNLAAYVVANAGAPYFDYQAFKADVAVAQRFLDNVIDATPYFLEENRAQQRGTRRTGLGTMGLADALIKLGRRYGSDESLDVIKSIYSTIRDAAYLASVELAKEKGVFPQYARVPYAHRPFIKRLPEWLRDEINAWGIRNAVILTQAPTGTTSLLAGVSSGIEPVFSFVTKRTDRLGEHLIYHPLAQAWKDAHPNQELPDYFVSSRDLTPEDHVRVQAAIQAYTDSSISKTVNAPNHHTVADVERLYMQAYDLGCKGVTYYREGSRDAVLAHVEETDAVPTTDPVPEHVGGGPGVALPAAPPVIRPRPAVLAGYTREIATPVGDAHVTVNEDADGPLEAFITVGRGGSDLAADSEAIGRLISLVLRLPSNFSPLERLALVAEQLQGIGGSSARGFGAQRVRSLADGIGQVLAEHPANRAAVRQEVDDLDDLIFERTVENPDLLTMITRTATAAAQQRFGDLCPECGASTLVFEEGCRHCLTCAYSAC